jgi:hypothetical protein
MIREAKPSQALLFRSFEPPRLSQAAVRKTHSESRAKSENVDFAGAWMFGGASPGRQ